MTVYIVPSSSLLLSFLLDFFSQVDFAICNLTILGRKESFFHINYQMIVQPKSEMGEGERKIATEILI